MKALFFENNLSDVIALKAASKLNRYAALGRFSPLKYKDIAEPEIPNSRWLKVKNISCGLCGTDLHFMFMDMDPKVFPAAVPGISRKFLGHELIGEVVEAGANVDTVEVGDRVAMRIDWPSCFQLEFDPPCKQCKQGNYMLCENQGKRNLPLTNTGGGFSPYMVMHKSQPFKIPEALTNNQALLIEPLASALHGLLKRPPKAKEKVLVVGAGTIGLLTAYAAVLLFPEAEVYALARHNFQAEKLEQMGVNVIDERKTDYKKIASLTDAQYAKGYFGNEIMLGGFDVVYDSVGNDTTINNSLRWLKGGGCLVLIGINFNPGSFDYTPIWAQEITMVGINCHATETDGKTSFDHAADLLLTGNIRPELIITHRFEMSDYKQAVKTFMNKNDTEAIKIVLDHTR